MTVSSRRQLGAGRATLAGLQWLASVGPAPLDAWAVAMRWRRSASYSHAGRLISAGWAARCSMSRGDGSLLFATARGVRVCGAARAALAAPPAPTSWAHHEACAWVAAWLTARGRVMVGPREVLLDERWRGNIEWLERDGLRRRGHRPDLAAGHPGSERLVPIEVELASKSTARLRSILALHASWIAAGKTGAVIYVCATTTVAEKVRDQAAQVGLAAVAERNTLRVELLQDVRDQAIAARTHPGIAPT